MRKKEKGGKILWGEEARKERSKVRNMQTYRANS